MWLLLNKQTSSLQDLLKILPQNVADQARFLFNVILDFCVGMICDPNRASEEFSMSNKYVWLVLHIHVSAVQTSGVALAKSNG